MVAGALIMAPDIPIDVTDGALVVFGFGGVFKPARCRAPATEIGLGAAVVAAAVDGGFSGGIPPGGRGLF